MISAVSLIVGQVLIAIKRRRTLTNSGRQDQHKRLVIEGLPSGIWRAEQTLGVQDALAYPSSSRGSIGSCQHRQCNIVSAADRPCETASWAIKARAVHLKEERQGTKF